MSLAYSGFLNLFAKICQHIAGRHDGVLTIIFQLLNNPCALNNQENGRVKWKATPYSAMIVFEDFL